MSFFDGLDQQFTRADVQGPTEVERGEVIEEQYLEALFKLAKQPVNRYANRADADDFHGRRVADLTWFRGRFTSFRHRLAVARLPFTAGSHIGWTDIWTEWGRLPWVRRYRQLAREQGWLLSDTCHVLIFNVPRLRGSRGLMVLMNQPPTDVFDERGTLLVCYDKQLDTRLVMRPLADYAAAVPPGWWERM